MPGRGRQSHPAGAPQHPPSDDRLTSLGHLVDRYAELYLRPGHLQLAGEGTDQLDLPEHEPARHDEDVRHVGDVGRVKGLRAGKLDEAGDGCEGERVLEAPAGEASFDAPAEVIRLFPDRCGNRLTPDMFLVREHRGKIEVR